MLKMVRRQWQFYSICLIASVILVLLMTLINTESYRRTGTDQQNPGHWEYSSLVRPQYEDDDDQNQLLRDAVVNMDRFNITSGHDIIVFLHVQKTGGSTFLHHLTTAETTAGTPLCYQPTPELAQKRKREFLVCPLKRNEEFVADERRGRATKIPEMWLASERTYGWVCGVHPFLSEMKSCIPGFLVHKFGIRERDFHYTTMLRHPVLRYVSEYLHVSRGAVWFSKHTCDGRTMQKAMPPCYDGYYKGLTWKNVTFDRFTHCSSNWANNRQTIMLANLTAVQCLDSKKVSRSRMDESLLESAKANLQKMSFFGLSEYFQESCKLFEKQFNMKFKNPCSQKKMSKLHSASMLDQIWSNRKMYSSVVVSNHLDMQLYNFALKLFTARLLKYGITIDKYKVDKEIRKIRQSKRSYI